MSASHSVANRSSVTELVPWNGLDKHTDLYRAQRAMQRMAAGETVRLSDQVLFCFPDGIRPERIIPTPTRGRPCYRMPAHTNWGEVLISLLASGWHFPLAADGGR